MHGNSALNTQSTIDTTLATEATATAEMTPPETCLDLRPGEWVEVRSAAEIVATLDESGTLEGLLFMPEMLAHCGRRYQVYKRADRTCDAATPGAGFYRRMERVVHLDMLRCDGSAHGGCQAGCLMFWKEAWLRRTDERGPTDSFSSEPQVYELNATLQQFTQIEPTAEGKTVWRCQATDVSKASCPLTWWKPTQYVRDMKGNNVPVSQVVRVFTNMFRNKLMQKLTGRPFPYVFGKLKRTPVESLDLKPGEWVIVKSREEIMETLDTAGRNRGMTFESEMIPYCGKPFRVLRRVERIIQEATGQMTELAGVALILENVICASAYRRPCARSAYLYWREIWLRRAEPGEIPNQLESSTSKDAS